tara:strand:+ start:280 stop:489 length:210 start_codon:yes stop_codon:yes gene_type:complete
MSEFVYVVNQFDCEPYESYHDGIHKVFSTEESAESYVEENKNKVFPEEREYWDLGYQVSCTIDKVALEE